MSKRIATAVVLLIVAAIAGAGYYFWTQTPQYALQQAAEAAKEHDLERFQQYVDTERVSSRFVDDMLASVTEETRNNPFGGLAAGMVMMMRPQLAKAAQDSLERGVETGNFSDVKENRDDNPATAAEPYWRRAEAGMSGFRRIAYVKKDGKIAVAGLEIYDADLKMPFVVELKLRDRGRHWQVIELSNIPAVKKAIEKGTEKRLAEINAPIRQELANTIRFVYVNGSATSDRWGFDRKSSVHARFQNTSPKPIAEIHFTVAFITGSDIVGKIRCVESDRVEPGGYAAGVWSKDANQFIESDMLLFRTIDTAQAVPEVEAVKFDDGTVIELQRTVKLATRTVRDE